MTQRSKTYLSEKALQLMKKHHEQVSKTVNLVASENISSPTVRLALASDLIQRYSYHNHYCAYEELEKEVSKSFSSILNVDFADVRPISGIVANLVAYMALTEIGDKFMALKSSHGGHHSYMEWGLAGVRDLKFNSIPFIDRDMAIDVDGVRREIKRVKPKMIILGGTMLLFPQPTKEIVDLAEDNDVHVMYDVAHVFGLVFGRRFENPMDAGVAVMTTSTHKTFPGPQGGVVFSRAELSGKIGGVLSRVIANPHPNRIPALAIALEEIVTFGEEYASQIVSDAKALASALNERDIPALCEHRGFTETHQVVVDVSKHMSGEEAMLTLRKSGIFCTQTKIPKDEETGGVSGLRLGTAEVARLGMGISEMVEIAELIGRAVVDRKNVEKEVAELKKPFRHVKYCFDEAGYAYDYPLGMAVSSSHQG